LVPLLIAECIASLGKRADDQPFGFIEGVSTRSFIFSDPIACDLASRILASRILASRILASGDLAVGHCEHKPT
jgi:hypothetical protein